MLMWLVMVQGINTMGLVLSLFQVRGGHDAPLNEVNIVAEYCDHVKLCFISCEVSIASFLVTHAPSSWRSCRNDQILWAMTKGFGHFLIQQRDMSILDRRFHVPDPRTLIFCIIQVHCCLLLRIFFVMICTCFTQQLFKKLGLDQEESHYCRVCANRVTPTICNMTILGLTYRSDYSSTLAVSTHVC